MTKERPVIIQVDNVRIVRWNDMNVCIEREESYYNPLDKAYKKGWRVKGYYSDVNKALAAVNSKGLLVDLNGKESINDWIKAMSDGTDKIVNEVRHIGRDRNGE